MMNDLVSRQTATQTALEFIVEYLGGAFDEDFQRKLIERMNALPSADRPQGEWIDDGFAHHCSICGKQGVGIEYNNYCPDCGSQNRKESK